MNKLYGKLVAGLAIVVFFGLLTSAHAQAGGPASAKRDQADRADGSRGKEDGDGERTGKKDAVWGSKLGGGEKNYVKSKNGVYVWGKKIGLEASMIYDPAWRRTSFGWELDDFRMTFDKGRPAQWGRIGWMASPGSGHVSGGIFTTAGKGGGELLSVPMMEILDSGAITARVMEPSSDNNIEATGKARQRVAAAIAGSDESLRKALVAKVTV